MSSKRFAPLNITPEFPLLLSLGLTLVWALGLLGLSLAELTPGLQLAGAVLSTALAVMAWRRHVAGGHAARIRAFGRDARGRWWVQTATGAYQRVRLCPDTTLYPGLLVLQFVPTGAGKQRRFCMTLTRGRVEPDVWRRLLVVLRHEQPLAESP